MKLKLKKSIFFVNYSLEAIVHLVQKTLLTCKKIERELRDLVSTLDQTRIKGLHDGFSGNLFPPPPPPPI